MEIKVVGSHPDDYCGMCDDDITDAKVVRFSNMNGESGDAVSHLRCAQILRDKLNEVEELKDK